MSDLSTELFHWYSVEKDSCGRYTVNFDKYHGSHSCMAWGGSNPSRDAGDVFDPALASQIARKFVAYGNATPDCFFTAYRREDNSEVAYIAIPEGEEEDQWSV